MRKTTEERFWIKVDKDGPGECWIWTASCTTRGYGKFWLNGHLVAAHRLAYTKAVGPIPDGLQIDHLCRVRRCVNPAHLEPVTCRENLMRGVGLVPLQVQRTHCRQGHPYSGANLYRTKAGKRACNICLRERARYHRKRREAT